MVSFWAGRTSPDPGVPQVPVARYLSSVRAKLARGGSRAAVLCAAAALALPAAVPAQERDRNPIVLKTQEVLLDLVVTDAKGRRLTDLKPDEVHVYEEGQPQTISSFGLAR